MESPENATAEYNAFVATFDKLVTAIKTTVEELSRKTFAETLITAEELSNVGNQTIENGKRATTLLEAILLRIKLNPTRFVTFLHILEGESVYKDIVHVLRTRLHELKTIKGIAATSTPSFHFPTVYLAGFSADEIFQLKSRLFRESIGIRKKFHDLTISTFQSLSHRNVPIKEITLQLFGLNDIRPVYKHSDQQPLSMKFAELQNAETVTQVMVIISDYSSFFNYEIIERLISSLGNNDDKANLITYIDEFTVYAQRKVYLMPSKVCQKSQNCQAHVCVIMDKSFEDCTVDELHILHGKMCEVLEVKSDSLQLCHVKPGSLELTFQVPPFVRGPVFPLSPKQEAALTELGVLDLSYTRVLYQFSRQATKSEAAQAYTAVNEENKKEINQDAQGKACFGEDIPYELAKSQVLEKSVAKRSVFAFDLVSVESAGSAPYALTKHVDAAVDDDTMYIIPSYSLNVFAYKSTNNTWFQLPDCRTEYCSIAVVNKELTTIGGHLKNEGKFTNQLFSYTEGSWKEKFPPMNIVRRDTRAACCDTHLIVGGYSSISRTIVVEVMNTTSFKWSQVADMPHMLSLTNLVVCGEDIYSVDEDRGIIFRCSTTDLIQSTLETKSTEIWSELECSGTFSDSTYVALHGHLVSIGGEDSDGEPTTAIRTYCPTSEKKWEIVGHMKTPRRQCLASALPNSSLIIVVGGFITSHWRSPRCTEEVEIATFV